MGYGKRALELLQAYYEGKRQSLDENEVPAATVPTVDAEVSSTLPIILTFCFFILHYKIDS